MWGAGEEGASAPPRFPGSRSIGEPETGTVEKTLLTCINSRISVFPVPGIGNRTGTKAQQTHSRGTEMTAPPTTVAPRGCTTVPRCSAQGCDGLVDGHVGGRFCASHRRALTLTAAVTDALVSFLAMTSAPGVETGSPVHRDVAEAGECFAAGLGLLIGTAFGDEISVEAEPIRLLANGTKEDQRARWRINFQWRV